MYVLHTVRLISLHCTGARFGNVAECKYLSVAPKEECKDSSHLESMFQDLIDKGGEGIILRDPSALYSHGRSKGYLKHKVEYFL